MDEVGKGTKWLVWTWEGDRRGPGKQDGKWARFDMGDESKGQGKELGNGWDGHRTGQEQDRDKHNGQGQAKKRVGQGIVK